MGEAENAQSSYPGPPAKQQRICKHVLAGHNRLPIGGEVAIHKLHI